MIPGGTTLLQVLNWVIRVLAIWSLITGIRCLADGQLDLPPLFLPHPPS